MTNEQLAILLQDYVNQLDPIIAGLIEALYGVEVERELVTDYRWKSKEPKPILALAPFTEGYELEQSFTGDPTMLFPLKEFKEQLERNIEVLKGEE